MLFANAWAIHHNEDEYISPDDFIPERFLDNKFGIRREVIGEEDHRRVTYGISRVPQYNLLQN